jgi:hypothetical protein
MDAASGEFERRFGVRFESLTLFSNEELARLHAHDAAAAELPPNVRASPDGDLTVEGAMATLRKVANGRKDLPARRAYTAALQALYGALATDPRALAGSPDTLCVGPQREGAQLASSLGCLPAGRSIAPHAKRIPYDGGLLVGLADVAPSRAYERCVVVDGAIATGATLIAILDTLRHVVGPVEVFAAHATPAGLWALARFGKEAGIELTVHVAAISGELDDHYYAVDPGDGRTLVVGDLGDTIDVVLPSVDLARDRG